MLDLTLRTEFIPSTNIKGEVTGANWSFVLPNLELARIVCLGMPRLATLATMTRLGTDVIVLYTGSQAAQVVAALSDHNHSSLRLLDMDQADSVLSSSVDLVLIAGPNNRAQLGGNSTLLHELQRILKPQGLIYFEQGRGGDQLRAGRAMHQLLTVFPVQKCLWLTPMDGEMHTAVLAHDQATINYFLDHGLTSRSIDLGIVKRMIRALNRPRSAHGAVPSMQLQLANNNGKRNGQPHVNVTSQLRGRAKSALFFLFNRTQHALDRIERGLSKVAPLNQFTQRYGILAGRASSGLTDQPPQYLREIAGSAGVSIDRYRWGLSARGEYSSRKVLFFLFDQAKRSPDYIVKMTRDMAFNPRLENEYRALALLAEKGMGELENLPQVVFFGYHNALALVGETVIEGVPFEQRTSAAADCRYAHAAVEWLTKLGSLTANQTRVDPGQVAEILGTLLDRFAGIYRLTPAQHNFLLAQNALIAQSGDAFPLVFQHGDPGTWNILVTETDQIAFLDWEAAEPQGMPLWDLFYFVRTYGAWAARSTSAGDVLKGFTQQFLSPSPFSRLLRESTRRYCQRVGLSQDLIQPLFYTCWMHRALKESTRLTQDRLDSGHYVSLLRASIDQCAALDPLFR